MNIHKRYRKYCRLAFCVFVICAFANNPACRAQNPTTNNVEFEVGELQMVAPHMSQFLRLQRDGDKLRFSRDWKDPLHDKSREEIVDMVFDSLTSRDDFAEEESGDLAEWIVRASRDRLGRDTSEFGKAVRAIAMFATTEMSSGGTAGGRRDGHQMRLVRNGMSFDGCTNAEELSFDIEENLAPFRTLHVYDDADGRLIVQVCGAKYVVHMTQQPNGKFQVVYLGDEMADSFTADNFATFQVLHSEVMDRWLSPLFKHIGIGLPDALTKEEKKRIAAALEASPKRVPQDVETQWITDGVFFESAGLQLATDFFGRLIKLRQTDQKLILDREFDEFGGRPTRDEMRDDIRKRMEEFGGDAATIDAMMARVLDEHLPPPEQKPLRQAFEEFRIDGGRSSGGGSTGGGKHVRLRRHNDELSALGTSNGIRISLRFIEKNSPQRTLALSDSGEGNFSISIFNEAGLIDIRQHRDGKFRVARFENDRLDVIDSTSFNELATKSPKMVKDWLFPLLKHYGIDPPLTADSESEK